MLDVRRRDFIRLLSGAAATWPVAARAQQAAMPVIGFLHTGSSDAYAHLVAVFRQSLHETGYVEGQNVVIQFRWAEGHYDQLPAMAADLVQRRIAVIVATATPAALAAKAATSTIPIVFGVGGDPVKFGLVSGFAQSGGNATGVYFFTTALAQKRLGLLHELVPQAAAIGFLVNPANPNTEFDTNETQAAATALGHRLVVVKASTETEIEKAFLTLAQAGAAALVIGSDGFFSSRLVQLATLAARDVIPTAYSIREFAAAGGLLSYASSQSDAYRQMGIYSGQILKGAKPTDLPIVQPTKFELVINLKTAKALGITIPPGMLAIADEVIE
jgi:putative tryptophan/tyrosine transport system substrate-binding protein